MYVRSSTVLLGCALAGLLCCGSATTSAAARRQAPDLRGSYFGHLRSFRGDLRQADAIIVSQNARWVGGRLSLASLPGGASLQGTMTGSSNISLIVRASPGQRAVRIKLRGQVSTEPNTGHRLLTGSYVITGAIRETGTFELVGGGGVSE